MTARDPPDPPPVPGLISRLLGRGRPSAEAVTASVASAVAAVPGVIGQDVAYNHLQYSSGALSGTVDVDAPATFDDVLRAAYAALGEQLGDDVRRVVVYLSGRTADGATTVPGDFGLPQRPTGADLARRYS